jgi:hypothetical protein
VRWTSPHERTGDDERTDSIAPGSHPRCPTKVSSTGSSSRDA